MGSLAQVQGDEEGVLGRPTFVLCLSRTTLHYPGNTDKCVFLSSMLGYPFPHRALTTVLTPQIVK